MRLWEWLCTPSFRELARGLWLFGDLCKAEIVKKYFKGIFDFSVGEKEGIRRKPFPDSVFNAMEYLGADKNTTVYVGDSEVDVETAFNSGIPCIAVTWGFRDKMVLEKLNPGYLVEIPEQIIEIIE